MDGWKGSILIINIQETVYNIVSRVCRLKFKNPLANVLFINSCVQASAGY